MSVLYISYDGILEPLGRSQVFRYLERLSATHSIVLVSFEKKSETDDIARVNALRKRSLQCGMRWIPLRYHKRPSVIATAFDIIQGMVVCSWVTLRHDIRIVHARSYVPSVIALTLKKLFRVKYIFDMRGFWADERVDAGLWTEGSGLFRMAKWFERRFLLNADCIISLTRRAAGEIARFPYLKNRHYRLEVITTCTDLELFKPGPERDTGRRSGAQFTLGYVGSVGTWYLFDEVLRFFKLLQADRPGAILHILNRGDHDYIRERLRALQVDLALVRLESGDAETVAEAMRHMDAGVFFIKPVYSKTASAPTRLGEFLATGIPCLSNSGVGDVASILNDNRVGLTVDGFSETELLDAAAKLLAIAVDPETAASCRSAATRYFSLQTGVAAYENIYRSLH